jgi:hypothetical protein
MASGAAVAGTARTTARIQPPAGIRELFLPAVSGNGPIEYRPMILGAAKLHYVDARLGVDVWQTAHFLAPIADDGREVLWAEARDISALRAQAGAAPAPGSSCTPLPSSAARTENYPAWGKALSAHLYETARAELTMCEPLKQTSNPGECVGDFRARLGQKLREQRDAAVEHIRDSYAPKLAALQDRLGRAEARAEKERSDLSQSKLQTAVSVGATILSAFLGKRALSASSMGRAATALRSASRIGREQGDVARADESATAVQQKITELAAACEAEIQALAGKLDPASIELRSVQLAPRKSDLAVGELALAWQPWRTGADGFPAAAC